MRKLIHLSFLLFLLPLCIYGQTDLSKTFVWKSPQAIFFDDQTSIEYAFEGASISGEKDRLPHWVETFPVSGPGQLSVEVINVAYENFNADPRTPLDVFPDDLEFETLVYRQPEGYFGRISLLPIVRGLSGVQRVKSIELRINHRPGQTVTPRFEFASRSVLADGDIYKFAVAETGIYKIDRAFLTEQLGIDLDGVDPRSIRLYGQVGGMLPEIINEELPDDLTEQAIYIEGEGDGNFDGSDFILFYAEGPSTWKYNASNNSYDKPLNIYTNKNFYYIKIGLPGNGLRTTTANSNGGVVSESYDALYRFEEDKDNILHELGTSSGSGKTWFGDLFRVAREKTYSNLFNLTDLVEGQSVKLKARMGLRSRSRTRFMLEVQGQEISSSIANGLSSFSSALTTSAVRFATINNNINLTSGQLNVKLNYPAPSSGAESEGYLDYIQLKARRQLRLSGDQMVFSDSRLIGENAATFRLSNANSNTRIWKIANGAHQQLNGNISGNQLSANTSLDPEQLGTFVAFNTNGNFPAPEAVGKVENQNLHDLQAADMLIIAHPTFLENTEALATHRREHSGLNTTLVTTDQVFNEFSAGKPDPAAIRNYARMVYERSENLRFLLLVGDGSFDARNIYDLGTNFVPVYEHQNNFSEVNDYPADDFFGIFTAALNGSPLDAPLNISVGRLPVRSAVQAKDLIDKIISYDINPKSLGDWRTKMVFVGDDEDNNQHSGDVDEIAEEVAVAKPELNFDKLYFDLFPQQSLSAGQRYPDVTEGLDLAVTRGALAITYLGHGGPRGWAQERVLSIPQIRNWTNPDHLPIFITATCTFAAYDDAEFVSAGEEILLSSRGGGIGLLTTTRPVYANANALLTSNTLKALIQRPNGQYRTLGEVIRIAKNQSSTSGNTRNVRKFTLLGDPATIVALPDNKVRTTMINGEPIEDNRVDTIGALQQITINGEVTNTNNQLLEDFNGLVYPTVYDKPQIISTLQQDPSSRPMDVKVQRNIIFRGKATVTNGKFSFTFVVPRDINYNFGQGKISYYVADPTTKRDGSGFYDQLIIGGTYAGAIANDEGPEVEVYMNNEDFQSGGKVEEKATLLVKLRDDLGINVTGNSIGHDLEAVLDENTRSTIVLNDYYEANADDFRAGEVRYPLVDLEPGKHSITVRAWDVANNSATGSTEFIVAADGRSALSRVLNYPNPFTDKTCFQFDHTLDGQDVDVIIQIYTVSGRLVKSLTGLLPFSDGSVRLDDCIEWDGKDDYGDQLARGVYLYQVRLRGKTDDEIAESGFEKIVILK